VATRVLAEVRDSLTSESLTPPQAAAQPLAEPLSERELEVLGLIAAGLTNPEIAGRLFIAKGTVKRHINNIYGKLQVRHRTEAIARARDLGLL
jgi:LuxR family maltose regulon positive regulatory protein